ncbi:hypothetical protein Tsubulata_013432 [Turnera subulata]|uniref:Uncharacterized protein n=1 Tax=Turnera subulata TaxID=218843 RepID=A0A9Q0FRP6_9ROSI|nr:hypothetical protein Tsubulata_013432 [Turnera subulata]
MAAVSAENVESWLPTEFLTEKELLLMDKKSAPLAGKAEFQPTSLTSFPTEFPYEFDSFCPLGSPGDSLLKSSPETETTDEDDFLAGLTRRLTQQLAGKSEKNWVMAGSPESTLSGTGSWSASSNGSPNGVLSPPRTPFAAEDETLELIYAAAGQVARLKMNSDGNNNRYYDRQVRDFLAAPTKAQNLVHNTGKTPTTSGIYSTHGVNYGQNVSQRYQYYQNQARQENLLLKSQCASIWERQQLKAVLQAKLKAQAQAYSQHHQEIVHSRGRSTAGCENGGCMRPPGGYPRSSWTPLRGHQQHRLHHQVVPQQHSASSMRAVFLSGSGAKRESTGTGVFLPRRYGNHPPETKRKSASPAVLLPAKVVQALNLNFDEVNVNGPAQSRLDNALASDYDILIARRNALLAQQRHNLRQQNVLAHDLPMPQEWMY